MMRILQSGTRGSRPHLGMSGLIAQGLVRAEPRPVDDAPDRRRRRVIGADERTEPSTGTH